MPYKDPVRQKEAQARWYQEHKEELRPKMAARKRKWREANREHINGYRRMWRARKKAEALGLTLEQWSAAQIKKEQ